MKWSEFKKLVDEKLESNDPEILYFDFDDFTVGNLNIEVNGLGLIITECESPAELSKNTADDDFCPSC